MRLFSCPLLSLMRKPVTDDLPQKKTETFHIQASFLRYIFVGLSD
jgi:hypothetical protein